MKKFFVLLLFITVNLFAQNAGNTGLSFLKIGFGARNLAMGNLGVVSANDVTALNYNPALLVNNEKAQIFIEHNQWIQGLKSEVLGVSFHLFGLPFAIGANTTSINDIQIRKVPGPSLGTFNAHYFFGSISTAYQINKFFSTGVTVKYLYEGLFTDESTGLAFDFGFYSSNLINHFSFGASFRNFGSMNKLRNISTKLPADFQIGTVYNLDIKPLDFNVKIISGIQKYTAVPNLHFHFGGEVFYNNLIAFRAGYITGFDSKGFSAGIGILWNSLKFDYAYIPHYNLGSSNTVSVIYQF